MIKIKTIDGFDDIDRFDDIDSINSSNESNESNKSNKTKKINSNKTNVPKDLNDLENQKITKIKKNINIFKKDKIIKIKITSKEPKKKSMEEALKSNEVLLWGLNCIDSILLNKYQNIKKKESEKKTENNNLNKVKHIEKTQDTEYNPSNTYNICDLEFLNLEYDRIENKICQMDDLTDEYDNLLDLQDSLTEVINELVEQSKENTEQDLIQNQIIELVNNDDNSKNTKKANNNTNSDDEILMEVVIDKKKATSKKRKPIIKTKKLKPYYWIGEIPEGYREATEIEAIVNKKVSFYGKKRVNRELNSLFQITGSLYIEITDKVELNKQIMALKGKLKYYKKEIEYHKISLDSDANTEESIKIIQEKITEAKKYYKRTSDIYNLYVNKYNTLNIEVNK